MPGAERNLKNTDFLRSRELLIALISAFQHSGHLPTADDIERYTEYKLKHYEEQFGSLSNAYEEAGLVSSVSSKEDSDDVDATKSTNFTDSDQDTSILDSIGEEFDSL